MQRLFEMAFTHSSWFGLQNTLGLLHPCALSCLLLSYSPRSASALQREVRISSLGPGNNLISINLDTIIQLFEWTWDSVAAECTNFIGPKGELILTNIYLPLTL